MIGLDTNVLLRYIVRDDPVQAGIATTFMEACCTADTPGFIGNIVLVELIWVPDRGYGYDKNFIITVLKATAELRLENARLVWQAIIAYQAGSAGFADCLLAVINRQFGCKVTYTFDRNTAKNAGFELLSMVSW